VPLEKELTGDDFVFRGPELKRLTADSSSTRLAITGTAPAKPASK